jgi:hypothetical protein
MNPLRIAFVTGTEAWLQKKKLAAKYMRMRFEGLCYPDVFGLPYLLGNGCDFFCDGERVPNGKYDLLMSELNASEGQLRYLHSLVMKQDPPVAVIPGPPEIVSRELSHSRLLLVREILSQASYVWSYSETVRDFCDGLIGRQKAQVIPWPFDAAATARIGARAQKKKDRFRVLLNAPLRFCANTQNFPFILKAALLNVWGELPFDFRERVTFHSFVYNSEDEALFRETGFAQDLPIILESRRQYRSFVRFIGECDAVINLLYGNVLGRITFLAGALGKPGIFSDSSEINRQIYPGATIPLLSSGLREMMRSLLCGIFEGCVDRRFLPSMTAVAELGDFQANSLKLQGLVKEGTGSRPAYPRVFTAGSEFSGTCGRDK